MKIQRLGLRAHIADEDNKVTGFIVPDDNGQYVLFQDHQKIAEILDGIGLVLESNGYVHMTNAEGIAEILKDLVKAKESARLDNMFP